MRDKKVLEMTTIAMFSAIIAIMSFVPWLGYITIGGVAVTLIHIPVLIGGIIGGRRVAITLATVFGVLSMIRSFITPDALNIFFQNPLVSVLPRILFGIALWYVYVGIKWLITKILNKLNKNKDKEISKAGELAIISTSFGISTFIHTVLTLIALYLFAFQTTRFTDVFGSMDVLNFIWVVLAANGVIEILLAIFIAGPIGWRVKDYYEHEANKLTEE
jgi:uncharacterized membrane protein